MVYIRVEAQNLLSTVLDTDKLSVTRGGSLRWREAMVGLAQRVKDCAQIILQPISTGASIGEFTCDTDPSNAIERALRHDYPELTFAISAKKTRQECELGTRWQQFQQLTVASERGSFGQICDFTKVRAAPIAVEAREKEKTILQVGWNVHARHEFGRAEKQSSTRTHGSSPLQRFYERETDQITIGKHAINSLTFSNEFSEIAGGFPFAALNNKLAVFYTDGNKFSRFVVGKTDEELSTFDTAMTKMREQLLATLLAWVVEQRDVFGPDKPIPFEVLLWGGDEYTFVLPAWLGWEFTQRFFAATKYCAFLNDPLTHAAGLVFCHHKTPIGRIRDLARELADGVKTAAPMQNAFDYLVLESLDFPAQSIPDYWEARVLKAVALARKPLIPNAAWLHVDSSRSALAGLKNHQTYRLAHALGARSAAEDLQVANKRLVATGVTEAQIQTVRALFTGSEDPDEDWTWIHLRELGQYLYPEQNEIGAP